MGDDTDGTKVIDGTLENVQWYESPLSEQDILTIHKTWDGVLSSHWDSEGDGIRFPGVCISCGEEHGWWDFEVSMTNGGEVETTLTCKNCGRKYKNKSVVE